MSLVAWYPLNGDIKDYSGNNYHLINNSGVHVVSDITDGKLSSCYNFDGVGGFLANYDDIWKTFNVSEFSITAWVKLSTAASGNNGSIGIMSNVGYISYTLTLNMLLMQFWSNTINNWVCSSSDVYIPTNEWHHIAASLKNNSITFYIDGVKIKTVSVSTNLSIPNNDTFFCIGCDFPGGDEYYNGKCNDVMVFDHALTTKEVRDIYKTCVLHYNFNDPYVQPFTNMYNGTQVNASYINLTYNFETIIFEKYGFTKALKLTPAITNDTTQFMAYSYMIEPALLLRGKTYTFVCYGYCSEDCNADLRVHVEGGFNIIGNSDGTTSSYIVNTIKGKVQLIWVTFTVWTGASDYAAIMFYPNPNQVGKFTKGYQLFTGLQLYEGNNMLLPYPWTRDGVISDNSGRGGDGLMQLAASPKFIQDNNGRGYYKFNGNNQITAKDPISANSSFSISFWMNYNTFQNDSRIIQDWHQSIYTDRWLLYSYTSNMLRFLICKANVGTDANYVESGVLNSGQWYHVCAVYDNKNSKILLYIDSVLVSQAAFSGSLNPPTTLTIGKQTEAGYGFDGVLDDIKIYATALTPQDIDTIYDSKLIIDSNNNIYCNNISEIDGLTNGKFKFNTDSILKCNEIDEIGTYGMDIKSLDDGSIWAKIFHHTSRNGTVLFTSNEETLNIQTNDKYSKLYLLEKFRGTNSKFEFLLEYPIEAPNAYNRWKQTSNPATATTPNNGVTGYEAISISWASNWWGGLEYNGAPGLPLCDGAVNDANWWFAIGCKDYWSGSIPGPGIAVQYVELWVRIDTATLDNSKFKITRDNVLMAKSFNE